MHRFAAAGLAALALATLAGASNADAGGRKLRLNTDFGPLTLRVTLRATLRVTLRVDWDSGTVEGVYPKYDGRVYGRLADAGHAMRGVWVQADNDHKCSTARYGSHAWGHFVFAYGGQPGPGAQMAGSWG